MEKNLILTPQFETVYSINGIFSQNGVIRTSATGVFYITVFPLDATFLPYTVKIVGRNVNSNAEFCTVYELDSETDIALLRARNNFVYTPQKYSNTSPPVRLFEAIKQNRIDKARKLMSRELNDSIGDENLISYFENFSDIVSAHAVDKSPDKFILCRSDGSASFYKFVYKEGLIDDIEEIPSK